MLSRLSDINDQEMDTPTEEPVEEAVDNDDDHSWNVANHSWPTNQPKLVIYSMSWLTRGKEPTTQKKKIPNSRTLVLWRLSDIDDQNHSQDGTFVVQHKVVP